MKREVAGLAEFDLDVPEMSAFPARIGRSERMTDEALFNLVTTKFARKAASLSLEDMYFFHAEISNQALDAYMTKMAESSLRNYAEDATAGVAFQNSHKARELGVGYVINGEYVDTTKTVLTDMYTVRGLKLNADLDTDNFIRGVDAGLIRDVSIGFKPDIGYAERCNICGREWWDYDCRHIPGMTYDVPLNPEADPTNQPTQETLAFIWIENARLSEVSAVYDGATPGAMILTKAVREQRAGRLSPRIRSLIESRYHIDLVEPRRTFGGLGSESERPKTDGRSTTMTLEEALEKATNAESAARAAETKASEASERATKAEGERDAEKARADAAEARVTELTSTIRSTADGLEGVEIKDDSKPEEIARSVRMLIDVNLPLARQIEELRTAEIDAALESGVRAFGDEFDKDKKRTMLDKLDLADIRDQAKDWEERAVGSGKFKGGRTSAEEGDDPPADGDDSRAAAPAGVAIPASAFGNI